MSKESDDFDRKLVRLWQKGLDHAAYLADALDTTPDVVRRRLRHLRTLGASLPRRKRTDSGASKGGPESRQSDALDRKLVRLWHEDVVERCCLADALDVSPDEVRARIRHLRAVGVSLPPRQVDMKSPEPVPPPLPTKVGSVDLVEGGRYRIRDEQEVVILKWWTHVRAGVETAVGLVRMVGLKELKAVRGASGRTGKRGR